jgi:hypothetical protein
MGLSGDDDRHRQSGEHPDSKAIDHEHSFFQMPIRIELCWKIVSHSRQKENWPELVALTSYFSVELPGIEPRHEYPADLHKRAISRAEARETTPSNLRKHGAC